VPEKPAPLLALFSDFGVSGPYVGQVMAVWAALAPMVPRVDLFSAAPPFDVEAGAHLLDAYARALPPDSVVEAVVDPGVGGPREVLVVRARGMWFCGPDNGLLSVAARRDAACRVWRVDWRPPRLSATFHGRDLFAPVAAHLALTGTPPDPAVEITVAEMDRGGVVDPANRVVLIDPYGNLVTGIPARGVAETVRLAVAGHCLPRARRFGAVPPGEGFWYENANGLIEVAVNRGNAAAVFGVSLGEEVRLIQD